MDKNNLKIKLNQLAYFFSLVLEDYIGDIDELMDMADLEEEDLNEFLEGKLLEGK